MSDDQVAGAGERRELISFRVGQQEYCVDIMAVREIRGWSPATSLPQSPSYMRGVINLRGAVVPVADLSVRFGRTAGPVTKRTCIVIVEITANNERQDVGVVVDAVNEVLDMPASEIEPPPTFGAKIRTDFIQGMGKVNGKFVVLLDVNHVLAFDEIVEVTQAAEAIPA